MNKFRAWLIRKLGGVPVSQIGPRDRQLLLQCDPFDVLSLRQELSVASNDYRSVDSAKETLISELCALMRDQYLFDFTCHKDTYGSFLVRGEIRVVMGERRKA